jgi:hypothetical protein
MSYPQGAVFWRFKKGDQFWKYGWASLVGAPGAGLVRMGAWNGDATSGVVVSVDEIEWRA